MNLKELHSFKLSDAVKLHNVLNPKLWIGNVLRPTVRLALLKIADDFVQYLGISDLDVADITISGSNAAYSYTEHSDIDLHLIVDFSKLDPDDVYRELFTSKKNLYNAGHNITIHGIDVECYIQDSEQPHHSLGQYSVKNNRWIKQPLKRRAHIEHTATRLKYEKLAQLADYAERSSDSKTVASVLKKISKYRKAGLARGGEYSPENLAYKALRAHGVIDRLYKLRERLYGRELSIENMYSNLQETKLLDKPTSTVEQLAKKHGVSIDVIKAQLTRGIEVELEHTSDRKTACEIALDHLGEDPQYYTKLDSANLEEGASGYIPSEAQKSDPRFKTALTRDVRPHTLQQNARKLGSRIARDGRPPLLRETDDITMSSYDRLRAGWQTAAIMTQDEYSEYSAHIRSAHYDVYSVPGRGGRKLYVVSPDSEVAQQISTLLGQIQELPVGSRAAKQLQDKIDALLIGK